jgi:protein-tyrosine-phosphatase
MRPQAVLFACGQNCVRSVMAEAIAKAYFGKSIFIASAGVKKGEPDPFVATVLAEEDMDISKHRAKTFEEFEEWEGMAVDLIISLAPEAHHKALEYTRSNALEVEYWATPDPTGTQGSREQILDAYRQVRDMLELKIKARLRE